MSDLYAKWFMNPKYEQYDEDESAEYYYDNESGIFYEVKGMMNGMYNQIREIRPGSELYDAFMASYKKVHGRRLVKIEYQDNKTGEIYDNEIEFEENMLERTDNEMGAWFYAVRIAMKRKPENCRIINIHFMN